MSREKQIEEMVKELCVDYGTKCGVCGCKPCVIIEHCKTLYNAGYRKQEWISVDERLPEENTRVLVYLDETLYDYTHIDTDRIKRGNWIRWGKAVTHWMPLPEAPKMKGGAE